MLPDLILGVIIIFIIIFTVFLVMWMVGVCLRYTLEPTIAMCDCTVRLDGKTALVTGGNSGIGFETAKDLARRGARVIIADINNADAAVVNIIESTSNPNIEYMHLDLSKFSSIRSFADKLNKSVAQVDILVNNAGCMKVKKYTTEDGMDLMMQVNYLGPFYMTNLITEKLVKSRRCRIVNVCSGIYHFGNVDFKDLSGLQTQNFFMRYANSKLCVALWTKALRKYLPWHISAFYVHPGIVKTNIMLNLKSPFGIFFTYSTGLHFKDSMQGAQTNIHCCVAPDVEIYSGGYFANCQFKDTAKMPDEEKLVDGLWVKTKFFLNEYDQ